MSLCEGFVFAWFGPPYTPFTRIGMPRTILLAEDHEDNRFALLTVLQREGYAALGARNGREAVQMAAEHRPDMIVMDLAMPVLDGRGAVKELKSDARTRDIPVVALTAMSLTVSFDDLEAEGFAGLLTKPCMPPRLIAEVRRQIGPPEGPGAESGGLAQAGSPR